MRKIIVLMLAAMLFACNQKPKGFKINVSIDGAKGQAQLEENKSKEWSTVVSADIVDGMAVLEGTTDYPKLLYLSVSGGNMKTPVFIENTEMEITGKVDSMQYIEVTGSPVHDEYDRLNKKKENLGNYNARRELYKEVGRLQTAGDTARAKTLLKKYTSLSTTGNEKVEKMQINYVKENSSSYLSPYFIKELFNRMEYGEIEKLLEGLDPKLDSVQNVIDLKEQIAKIKRVEVGQIALDFTQNDTTGNPVKFSDIYSQNELTLLDFWAGWCGPCRKENPNVISVYNQFKDQGFNVIGVSLDFKKDLWIKAIEDDGLSWIQVSDLGFWDNKVSRMYAIRSIPTSFLVDKNGKIVAKNKKGEELKETVAKFLAQ